MPLLAQHAPAPPTPAEWTERQLLRRVLVQEERAWAELIHRYRGLIYRCITRVLGKYGPMFTSGDVDEVYADVLMNLLRDDMRKLRVYNPRRGTKLGSWIGMISINTSYDFLRGNGRRPLLDRLDGSPEPDPHDDCDRTPLDSLIEKERWTALNHLLAGFSDKDRTFVELYYAQGLDPETVADQMEISLKTVYSKKHKIRAHLRRCVQAVRGENPIADLVGPSLAMAA
jgi:RNA polymerase sigma-70 factor (ECF subfamily)